MNDDTRSEASPRNTIIAFLIVATAIASGAILLLSSRPQPVEITVLPPIPTATPLPTLTPGPITVYVTGAVMQPESLLTLPPGSRVEDAIEAAGGVTDEADMAQVNLAGLVRDGDQVHVPVKDRPVILATPSGGVKIFINTATVDEIDSLPGAGPALAEAIIAHREANGAFRSFDDLDAVDGVGPTLIADWQTLIVFD